MAGFRHIQFHAPSRAGPGFRSVVIEPDLAGHLDHAEAELWTPYGPVRVDWTVTGDTAVIRVGIPHGVEAALVVGGHSTPLAPGTHDLRRPCPPRAVTRRRPGVVAAPPPRRPPGESGRPTCGPTDP
ncbi:alpha-L-rhamnosidase C-terminal domain-containing protein [Streptomyces sp. NPDC059454]|uniref:alpha-L-rhamnosidase C-terminal domain-containing protein n=1 Tax=Streptomyces sp. NPDC059454 TaxID=3346836 RepID=UPI0036853707